MKFLDTIFNKVKYIILLLLVCLAQTTLACRFTVREIGFSLLSPTIYTLVVVDEDIDMNSPIVSQLQSRVKGSNIKVVLLHQKTDETHPFLKLAKSVDLKFPTAFLLAPDDRICDLFATEEYSKDKLTEMIENRIIRSPLCEKLLSDISDTFAYVLRIPGQILDENHKVDRQIQEDCDRIKDIMSLMPKTVQNPPVQLYLTPQQCQIERVVLWSLGINVDDMPEHPIVHIVYGRGRYMGKGLQFDDIVHGNVYRYLAMVGADCECNLDREWMLGTQVPMLWETKTRQALASSLDFDVDNPLIQAEMSRILSKEEPGGNATISFTPETIDLDEVFNAENKPQLDEKEHDNQKTSGESKATNVLWITLGGLLLFVIFISGYIILKRNND